MSYLQKTTNQFLTLISTNEIQHVIILYTWEMLQNATETVTWYLYMFFIFLYCTCDDYTVAENMLKYLICYRYQSICDWASENGPSGHKVHLITK